MCDRSQLTARVTAILVEQHGVEADLCYQAVEETLYQLLLLARTGDRVDLDYLGEIARADNASFVWTTPEAEAALSILEAQDSEREAA